MSPPLAHILAHNTLGMLLPMHEMLLLPTWTHTNTATCFLEGRLSLLTNHNILCSSFYVLKQAGHSP